MKSINASFVVTDLSYCFRARIHINFFDVFFEDFPECSCTPLVEIEFFRSSFLFLQLQHVWVIISGLGNR